MAMLLLASGVLYVWGIGSYALWDPWEPKYAQAVREMGERGDWLTPWLDGKIRWTKPILVYWAMALPVKLFGNVEWAVRLPSVFAALFGIWTVGHVVGTLRGPRVGWIAAAILATLPQYFYLARQATPDMLLTVSVTAALGFFALARFREEHRRRNLAIAYAAAAVGFLAKGPVACAIVVWTLILFVLPDLEPGRLIRPSALREDVARLWSRYRVWMGILIFSAVAGPWYVAMLIEHRGAFIDNFFLDENIQRFTEPLWGHTGTATRYLRTVVHGTFPWGALLPAAILFLFQGRTRLDDEARQRWFVAAWFLAVFSIFTVAGTKLDHYLLPIMPAVAFLIAFVWEAYLAEDRPFWVRPAIWISPLFLLMPVKDFIDVSNRYIFSVFVPAFEVWRVEYEIDAALWVLFAGWCAAMAFAAFIGRRGASIAFLLALLVAFGNGAFFLGYAMPAHAPDRSLKVYAERFDELAGGDAELVFYGWIRYSIRYYHGQDYRYFEPAELDEMIEHVQALPEVYLIAQNLYVDDMLEELHRTTASRWSSVSTAHSGYTLLTNVPQRRLRNLE